MLGYDDTRGIVSVSILSPIVSMALIGCMQLRSIVMLFDVDFVIVVPSSNVISTVIPLSNV